MTGRARRALIGWSIWKCGCFEQRAGSAWPRYNARQSAALPFWRPAESLLYYAICAA